jgi:hypothetical protein
MGSRIARDRYGGMFGDFSLPGHVNKGMTTDRLTPKGRQGPACCPQSATRQEQQVNTPGGISMFPLRLRFALVTGTALLDVSIFR